MQLSRPLRGFAFLWALTLILRPGAAQEPETISQTLAPVYAPLAEQIVNDYELREKRGLAIDLGSGPGDLIIELCKRTRWLRWVNADINPSVFPGFLERARAAGFGERVEAVEADAHALPFGEAYADIVVSRGSYPFWNDKVKAFGEIYRVLKPGGLAFIGRGFSENLPLNVAREIRERQRQSGKVPAYDVEQAAAELAEIMRALEIKDYRIRIPRRGDVNYGVWVEFRKPGGAPEPVTLLEHPGKESVGLDLSATVVGKAEMEELGAETVIDALGFVPGAWIESRGRKVKQFISFRGQKYPYPEYAIDGVLFREFHEVPYFLSTGDIERVEVMRSGGAMMAGNAGLVGLINVVPRVYSERQTSVQVEYGSFGTAHGHVSHGGRVRNLSYGLGVDGYRTDGPEGRHGEERLANYYGNLSWKPSDVFSMTTHLFHIGGSRGMVLALPPATRKLQTTIEGFDPIQTSSGTLNALYRPNERLSTQVLFGYSDRHNAAFSTTPAGVTTRTRDWDRELAAGADQSIALGGGNVLRAGAHYNHWVAPYGKRFYAGRRNDLETYSLAVTDEQRLGNLVLDGGVRYHRTYINEYGAFNIDEDANPYRNVPSLVNEWEPAAWSATLGAAYYFSDRFSLHGNLGGGTVEPRRGTLNASLQPPLREDRVTGDLGFRVSDPRMGTGTVSVFVVQRRNGINLSGAIGTINGRLMEFYENRDQDTRGVEFDLRSRRFRNTVQVFLNFTTLSARIDEGGVMLRDREIPRSIAGGGMHAGRWGFELGLFWKFVSSYESRRFADPPIDHPLGGFNTLDFTLSRRLGLRKQTRIYTEVRNAANRSFSTVVGYPDYGRRATIGLDYTF